MQKIMFNDRYGLTEAVLAGRKTMTRRILKAPRTMEGKDVHGFTVVTYRTGDVVEVMALDEDEAMIGNILPKYKVGEVVAVAQCLRDMGYDPRDTKHRSGEIWGLDHAAAWTNKMFVPASECIHQIRITNVRVERLQDINVEDIYKEGFEHVAVNNGWGNAAFHWEAMLVYDDSLGRTKEIRSPNPREAFATLIDKVSGNGTWESNPWVFVYEFELVKKGLSYEMR